MKDLEEPAALSADVLDQASTTFYAKGIIFDALGSWHEVRGTLKAAKHRHRCIASLQRAAHA